MKLYSKFHDMESTTTLHYPKKKHRTTTMFPYKPTVFLHKPLYATSRLPFDAGESTLSRSVASSDCQEDAVILAYAPHQC